MASDVNICNLALAHLGDNAGVTNISPPDGSQQADWCAQFYPIARDQLLSMHAWSFATKRIALALKAAGTEQPDTWTYCYAVPNLAINVISVLPPQGTTSGAVFTSFPPDQITGTEPLGDGNTQDFVQETLQDGTKVIFTNVQYAIARYVVSVTDTTKYSGLFVPALARLLASYLAGPVLKGDTGIKVGGAHYKAFAQFDLPWATTMDQKGQKQNAYKEFIPDSLQARA